ncbi:unnamed protein product [Porites lobata]|uniref:Uncharacterized protein n=1 Tax=Porites lobata TaxID=104759 RepID=A0ABN8NAS3_9CNID|nr:unnamed protein product [Porites lobata]
MILGGSPYPVVPLENQFDLLKSGYRMEKSLSCPRREHGLEEMERGPDPSLELLSSHTEYKFSCGPHPVPRLRRDSPPKQ